jgi:hypothetical protein
MAKRPTSTAFHGGVVVVFYINEEPPKKEQFSMPRRGTLPQGLQLLRVEGAELGTVPEAQHTQELDSELV